MSVQINVAANQAALTASIQAGVQAYNQRFAQNNQLNLTINPRAFSQPLGRITGDVKDFEAALAASNARVIAFGASTAVLGGVIRSFKELANVTIEVEKNLADINRVFGLTTSQLQKFSTDLFNVTKQTASSFNDASQAALEFSRQGLKAEETLQRTKDALTLTRLAGVSTANAVDALTSTVNGFAATGVTTTQILNKLVAVEQDFAVGAGDLAEALSRTGQAAQEAGVSLDQLNALVTSAQQSTARGGAVIGNALKTIFTRLQRTDTLDQLEAFNISVRDVQGNILPAVTILQNFAGAYQNLADAQRAQLSEQVAGVYQVNILKAIVNDLNKSQGVYAGALQRGAMATNEAEVATAKLNQTLDALLKQTATSTQQLANNIGKVTFEPLARYGTEQLKSLVESMNEILEGEGIGSTFANGLLKGIRNILAGPGAIAAFFTLFKLIQNSFTYLTQALPQIAGITTETQNRKNIEQSILQIMAQQGPVAQALAGTMGNQAAQAQLLLQVARQQTAEYQTQTALARQLAAQLAGQGVRVRGSGGLQVTRAGGYIPASTKMAEVVGAQAGGYSPGRVVPSPVGGVMNTAEDVKYIPGFAQPFINPPARSKAGRAHRQNAINRTGVDPYMFSGFIPNFVKKSPSQFSVGRAFEQSVGFDIKVPPSRNKPIDFKEVLEKPINKNFNPKLYQSNTFADAHSGLGHTSAENISKVINHIGQNYYAYSPKQGSKTKRLKIDDKTSIISQPDLLGDLFIRPRYTEIIGEGSDVPKQIETSSISSLNTTAKKTLLNGVSQLDFDRILRKKIKMQFAQDRVYGSGFIPNFAIPVDSARIPWFKKYASSYKNTASDKDVFRQIDFPTYGKGLDHNYAKVGNADMVSFLYEDFVRSAINIALGSKQVVRSKEAGFKHTPTNAISNRDPIDLTQKISNAKLRMIEVKQSKNNQKETISQISDAKLKGLFQENPELAKNVELMSIIFNDPRYVDPTGKNPAGVLSPFEQSIAPIVKNSYADVDPTMRGKLGLLTDGLMKRYQSKKNLFSKGFIPNFNFIKGRNSFQKNWLIETAKKRNLNLNDPNTFTKLATEFAKTYPNDQGMFGLNKGFIPNFAYKQAVMGLEESMSGNKAVFDTKPFPHIRNSSQPTFSSAISDHGGLSNALSDSMRGQKAAGLMSNGFVPNFAPRPYRYSGRGSVVDPSSGISQYSAGLGFSLADQERRAKDEFNRIINALRTGAMNAQQATTAFATLNTQAGLSARAQTSLTRILNREVAAQNQQQNQQQNTPSLAQRFLGARGERADRFASSRLGGVAGVLGGSLIGGQIESFIQGGRERYQMSTGERFAASAGSGILTATTTGAEIGSFIPGLGTAAGAAIGAIIGLSKAAYDSGETLQDLVASAEQYKTQINTTVDLSKSYIDQLSQLNSISNPSLLNQASFKLTETFQQLSRSSPELGRKFVEAGGDIDKMNKAIEEFTANANLISNIKNLKASYKEAGDKLSALIPERSNQLKRKGYNIIQGSGEIKNTEASLETSFIQFQSFFDLLKQSGLTAENSEKFIAEFQKEMQAATDESTLKAIAKKYNISETIATEIAALSDNVIDEMGVEGDYFVENSGILIKRFFDTTDNKFKTATQQVEKQQINARPIIKRIEDSISIFVMNTASKIQTLEFEQNRLKMLQDASNFYLESLTSPIEKAAKEAKFKSKELETKTLQNRQKITSDILENFGKNAAQTLGGSNVDTISKIEGLIKNIEIASPIDQLSTIERLITQTTSTTTAADAGFKVTDPKTLESLNSSLINFRKNLVSLIQTEKENSALLNLEIDINKRRSESAQKLLILQNQLIESDLRRTISIADQRSQIDIQENRVQNIRRLPGFGFGVSESQIAATNIAQNRGFMQQRQQQTRLEVLGGIKTETQGAIKPLIINFENTRRSLLKEMYSAGDYRPEQARNAGLELNRLNTEQGPQKDLFAQFLKNLDNVKSLEEANTLITNFFNTLDKTSSIYTAVKSQVEKVSGALRDINKESQIFESNANADIKIADVNDKINNAYIFRLNTLLQIEKAQRKVLNTIEIQEQILDVERSRPANFFGLGVTGKAEKQIGYDEKNLALRQRRQNAQAVQNVQQQLNQFETFRNKIQAEGLGPQSFGFPASSDKIKKAREAIMSLDTSKITNIDQAKNFVSELSKVRTQYGLQGEAAKTLADTEKEINSVLNSNVDELDKMRSIQDILNGKVRQEAKDRQSIRMGFKEGFDQIQDDADTGLNRLAKETPILFRDGMVEAIKATVRESDNLGNALMGIAAKFLDTFSTQLMTTGVSKIISGSGLGNLFGMQTGGVIRAQNGMYISGSGSGDKYPALLENGEYVLNRQAVMAMGGPSALDTLNFSMAPRFASGGSFDKKFEDVASMESNMTQMGLENSPLYNELTDAAKQQAQEDRRKRLAAKQQRAAMIGSLVAAAATVAIGAGISNVAKNAQATKAQNLSAKLQTSQPLTQAESGSIRGLMDKGLLSPSGVYTGGVPQTGLRSLFSAPVQGSTWYQKFGNTVSKPFRRNQTGGLIGSRLSDTIPGYMEGGLYNAPLIKKYSAGLQSGGSSMMADGNNSSTVNNNTSATNSFNFNTTVQRDGTINMGSNSTSYEQQDVELSKNLNNKIYAAVGEVIRKEKQFGGSLAGMRNS